MEEFTVIRADECQNIAATWGHLTWYANAAQDNSTALTVGKCVIRRGCENPRHSHPNCYEVLVVMQGTVSHEVEGGARITLGPGDTITIPQGASHNARNIGAEEAVLFVTFSSAVRETKGE